MILTFRDTIEELDEEDFSVRLIADLIASSNKNDTKKMTYKTFEIYEVLKNKDIIFNAKYMLSGKDVFELEKVTYDDVEDYILLRITCNI
jgi:hypothetical protein